MNVQAEMRAMAAGNGDERQVAAWERVEAKLDRQGERLDRIEARVGGVEDRVGGVEDAVMKLGAKVDLVDRKLDATRRTLEGQIDLARAELLQAIAAETRMELSGVKLSSDARIDELKGSIDALALRLEALEKAR
jgi:hypothetical protein